MSLAGVETNSVPERQEAGGCLPVFLFPLRGLEDTRAPASRLWLPVWEEQGDDGGPRSFYRQEWGTNAKPRNLHMQKRNASFSQLSTTVARTAGIASKRQTTSKYSLLSFIFLFFSFLDGGSAMYFALEIEGL